MSNGECNGETTIAKFIDSVFETKLPHAKKWVQDYIDSVVLARGEEQWKEYCFLPIEDGSASSLVFGVAARISHDIRGPSATLKMVEAGVMFVEEIQAKAGALGKEISKNAMNAIIMPKKFLPEWAKQ